MKILVVNNLYPPNAVGGYERLVALVASELARRGHEVSVLTSGHGGHAPPSREELHVERTLELLVSRRSIYKPFEGTGQEREDICTRNRATIARRLQTDPPDAVLVGNLFFLDRDVLEAFRPLAARTVYLLTDVWMIHFTDDAFLQDFFARTVFEPDSRIAPLVPADPPGLALDAVADPDAWARRAATLSLELARRRAFEAELARGRRVVQLPGTCHVCGPTSFVVQRQGTSALPAGDRRDVRCGRCGLDAPLRVALHVLDRLAAPPTDDGVLMAIADPTARSFLTRHFPRATVVASLAEVEASRRFRHVASVGERGDDVLARACGLLGAGGRAVVHAGARQAGAPDGPAAGSAPAFRLVECARDAALDAAAYDVWSREYGYLGPGELVCSARSSAAA